MIFYFGKYAGKTVEEVEQIDPRFLTWVSRQPWVEDDVKDEIKRVRSAAD